MIRIALDAMGGDFAPRETVLGAIRAAREDGIAVTLVGDEAQIKPWLKKAHAASLPIDICHAPENISMDENPATAVRRKKGTSIGLGVQLVADKKAEAFVSAGNTGAAMAASLFGLGRISGIDRPAIAMVWPAAFGRMVFLDVGANVDCRPKNLYQFARMGTLYAERVLGVGSPRVGLLSIGEEATKGNELVISTHPLLAKDPLVNFIGNIEGQDIFLHKADVVVCDGFIGNVVLKFAEGAGEAALAIFKGEFKKNLWRKLGALLFAPALMGFKKKLDFEEYGGAVLLGVNGITIISHGRSKARAVRSALNRAKEAAESQLLSQIRQIGQATE